MVELVEKQRSLHFGRADDWDFGVRPCLRQRRNSDVVGSSSVVLLRGMGRLEAHQDSKITSSSDRFVAQLGAESGFRTTAEVMHYVKLRELWVLLLGISGCCNEL